MWILEMPAGRKMLNVNQRDAHWGRRAKLTEPMRADAYTIARHLHVPRLQRARIVAVLEPDRGGRKDPGNWYPTAKAYVDGLVDAGVLDDDDDAHVDGPDMRLGDPHPGGRFVLYLSELPTPVLLTCRTPKRAAEVKAFGRAIGTPDNRVKLKPREPKTLVILFTDVSYPAEIEAWAIKHGHIGGAAA